MIVVTTPYAQFFDLSGAPLSGGKIYIGTAGQDPETHPIPVYWDAALTIPAAQPIPTLNGYPARNGSPATIYVGSAYSQTVRNKKGVQVFYAADSLEYSLSAKLDAFSTTLAADSGAGLIGWIRGGTGSVKRWLSAKLMDVVAPEDFGAVGDGVADDTTALQRAVDYCLANNVRELRSRRQFAVSGTVDISNFASGFKLSLGGLVARSNFPAVPSSAGGWRSATPMLRMGYTGGSQVGLNVEIVNVDGGGKADVVLITNNGCGGSRLHFDKVRNANIIVKLTGNTAPTASNYFTGSYWQDCKAAGYVVGGTTVCEGTTFDVGFIAGCLYGGLIFGNGSQYANVRGQLDFNGSWVTEMEVNSLAGFVLGDALNNGAGSTAELLAAYTYQGRSFLLIIETKSTLGGMTNFAVNNNLTNGYALATIVGIRTANQNSDARYFDIVSALTPTQPFWRALILCPYLGGIVGSNLWNCTVDSGNSASSYTTWIAGMQIYNSGEQLSLTDKRSSDLPFLDVSDTIFSPRRDVYLASNAYRGPDNTVVIPNGATVDAITLNTPASGDRCAIWSIQGMNKNDSAMRFKALVFIAAGASTGVIDVQIQSNVALTMSGLTVRITQSTGGTKSMYLTATRGA